MMMKSVKVWLLEHFRFDFFKANFEKESEMQPHKPFGFVVVKDEHRCRKCDIYLFLLSLE